MNVLVSKDQKRAMNVVFDCGDIGRVMARYLIRGGPFVPGYTLFALFASCSRGRRYKRVLLSFALGCKGLKPLSGVEAQVRQLFFTRELPCMIGRWPWVSRTPFVPPLQAFDMHCCAIGGSHPALLAFAGLGPVVSGKGPDARRSYSLQVWVPSVLPLHSGDCPPSPVKFTCTPFTVLNERIGRIAATRWSQSPTQTLLIISVETAFVNAFIVIFKVGPGGGLVMMHCARHAADEPVVRVCDVLDSGGATVCHAVYNREAVHFWTGTDCAALQQMGGFSGHVKIQCRGLLAWREAVYAVTDGTLYRIEPPPRGLTCPPTTRLCRLTFRGFKFVGPMCVNAEGDGLILLCNSVERDRMELVGYIVGMPDLYTVCNFPSEQDYRGDDAMGVLPNGSIVLCGREEPLVFPRDRGGVYTRPATLTLGHPSPLLQTLLVSESGQVRSVVGLHANSLVTVWGAHSACAPFRAVPSCVY